MTSSLQAYSGHKITSAVILTYKAHPLLHAPCRMWGNCSMPLGWTPTGSRGGGLPLLPPSWRPETQFGHPSARLEVFLSNEGEAEKERVKWRRQEVGSSLERWAYACGSTNRTVSFCGVLFPLLLGNMTAMDITFKFLHIFNEFQDTLLFENLPVDYNH